MLKEIQRAIRVLCEPGHVYELRCPKVDRVGTVSGYFDDFDALAGTADVLNGQVPAVFITLNPTLPALLARANNSHKYKAKNTTGDAEVTRRLRLLIDCDPIRPAGISSSTSEHEAALERVRQIRDFLTAEGFPMPLMADSGNGGHLIFGIDLDNDAESAELAKRFLESLASRFDDDAVSVDKSVWNASRISKLYGTRAMKGDPIPDRPQRYAQIIETPDKLEPIPVELLRKIAGHAEQPHAKPNSSNRPNTKSKFRQKGTKTPGDVENMMDDAGFEYRTGEPYNGGTRWELNECPNAEKHTSGPGGAAVFLKDGIVGFKCQHAHCTELHANEVFGDVNGKHSNEGKFDKLATEFVNHQNDRCEFPLFTSGQTYFYDQNRYVNCDELAMKVREFFKLRGWSQSNNIVGNVVPIVQSHAWRDSTKFGLMPFWIGDEQPFSDHRNVIAFQNGLLDASNVKAGLRPHSPAWCSTVCLPFEFDQNADCPTWKKFLGEVFEGDADRMALLQEFVGYCLSQDTSLQRALVLVGKPRSGKSTCQRVIEKLVGRESATGFALDKLATEFGLSALLNKSVALVGEVELSANPHRAKIVEILKSVIGEDVVSINEKHNPKIHSVRLPTRFIIATNQAPRLMDASGALGHRMLFVPFEVSFAGREDTELESKLLAELPGIAIWALEGLLRLRSNKGKFTLGDKHHKLSSQFSADTSPIAAWLKSEMVVSSWADPGDLPSDCVVKQTVSVGKSAAYECYVEFCEAHDIEAAGVQWFGRDLRNFIPKMQEIKARTEGGRERMYKGLGIRPSNPSPMPEGGETESKTESGPSGPVISIACATFTNDKIKNEENEKLYKAMEMTGPLGPASDNNIPSGEPTASSVVVQPQQKPNRAAIREAMNLMYTWRGDDGKKWIAMPTPSNSEVWKFGQMLDDGRLVFFKGEGPKSWAIEQIDQRICRIQRPKPAPSEPPPEVQLIPEEEFWAELAAM